MTITRPCYVTRERVAAVPDIKFTARINDSVDRAIETASDAIDGICHRRFYNVDETKYWDWPNFQRAYPWRLWLDQADIADITVNVPIVHTGAGGHSTPVLIPSTNIFWGPWNYGPPYTFMELDRSSNAAFGYSQTPQRDISIQATFGYWLKLQSAGSLAAAITDTTSTTITVTNSAAVGVGDVATIDSERMLVTGKSMIDTGQAQQGSGCSTASSNDTALTVTDGTKYYVNEILLLGAERMYVTDIAGNILTVRRAWDGTVLQTHTSAEIFAGRQLTVTRGDFGTTAATHSNSATININVVPAAVRDYALALSVIQVLNETGGYTGSQGQGAAKVSGIGTALASKLDVVVTKYARKARKRSVQMVTVIVKKHGALFDGEWKRLLEGGIHAAQDAVAQYAVNAVVQNLDDVLIENTGAYVSTIHSGWEGEDISITDGTVYGPWLEGLGSRNESTRFPGYWTFRQTTGEIEDKAGPVAEPFIAAAVQEINVR